jgi:hypothetical protein
MKLRKTTNRRITTEHKIAVLEGQISMQPPWKRRISMQLLSECRLMCSYHGKAIAVPCSFHRTSKYRAVHMEGQNTATYQWNIWPLSKKHRKALQATIQQKPGLLYTAEQGTTQNSRITFPPFRLHFEGTSLGNKKGGGGREPCGRKG